METSPQVFLQRAKVLEKKIKNGQKKTMIEIRKHILGEAVSPTNPK